MPSRSRSPDRRVPRSRECRRCNLLRRAPCRWAATSPCVQACGGEAAGGRPSPARRIVQFRARASRCRASCDEHLAVGQQRRRVSTACGGEAAGGRPGPASRIVQFRAGEIGAVVTSCDEHLAVGQQRRRMISACGGEAAGGRPGPARRIVEFRAREITVAADSTSCDEHLAVGQQRRRV